MAITKQEIFDAAAQIAAAGQRPTLEPVRQITGGSFCAPPAARPLLMARMSPGASKALGAGVTPCTP